MSQNVASQDRDLFDASLDWLLNCAASALGAKGTLGSVLSVIERGGVTSNGAFDHDAMLAAIGWESDRPEGECKPGYRVHRNVDRAKRLSARWAKLTPASAAILAVHYSARPGAPDSHNADASYASRSSVEQYLGECGRVALFLSKEPRKLLRACDSQGSAKTRKAAKDAAEGAVRSAHQEWRNLARYEAEAWAVA